jgi:hypothetical protein
MSLSRRAFHQWGFSAIGAAIASSIAPQVLQADGEKPGVASLAAQHVIMLWLNGGPSHVDTFDPKAKAEGGSKSIKTAAKGIEIAEHFPQLAAQFQKVALIRSVQSKEGNHQRAQEIAHTGHLPNPTVAAPSIGAWITKERAPNGLDIPPHIALGGPGGRAGFFGHGYDPYVIQEPGKPPSDLASARPMSAKRTSAREAFLDGLDATFAQRTRDPMATEKQRLTERARKMATSPQIAAFDVSSESQSTRDAYGDTTFGKGCLAARRLVEQGVPYVEVVLDGWDTHENNLERVKERAAILDPAMATLLSDLETRGLLSRTVVVCMGEFGRTPWFGRNGGRDHHPAAFSVAMAGGSIRGGVVHGSTDERGAKVVDKPVSVANVLATIAKAAGVDPDKSAVSPAGRPIGVTDQGQAIAEVLAG